ncbi:MAG: hypothetical protein RR367_00510 [Clostridia bacterium]
MSKQKTTYRIGVGASSILLIMVVLAMTALALLAYGSASSDEALTQRNLSMSIADYQATARVQTQLALIDEAVYEHREKHASQPLSEACFSTHGVTDAQWVETADGLAFTLTVELGDNRALIAEGQVFAQGKQRYTLLSHRFINTRTEENTDRLHLMGI